MVLSVYLYISFKKLQTYQTQKLAVIFKQLLQEKEKNLALKNKPSPTFNTQLKLKKITIEILNINFTYSELLKFL